MSISVYLAGFEVFAPDGPERAERMRQVCLDAGITPISPLDKGDDTAEGDTRPLVDVIYQNNIDMIERADAVVANVNHFRGPDPDAGTSFEVGFAAGRGKKTYVYSSDGATAVERVEKFYGPVTAVEGGYIDQDGMTVENFGQPFNLMLSSSSTVVYGSFEDCIARVAADVAADEF
jgi:nucleoside 2-deoxyribosyltransferase